MRLPKYQRLPTHHGQWPLLRASINIRADDWLRNEWIHVFAACAHLLLDDVHVASDHVVFGLHTRGAPRAKLHR
jgi:hypothetical protein